ncbi:MAG: hypothetical protein HRU40_14150 [Saprospiraceae bacterium]|nr:hypothetical protein [Saprospiraceae bacterium]
MQPNLVLLFLMIFGLWSCQSDERAGLPDVSNIVVEVDIRRFDTDLSGLDTTRIETQLAELEKQYPYFSDIYFNRILGSRDTSIAPQGHTDYVKGFIQFPPVKKLADTIQMLYPSMTPYEEDFRKAFQYLKHYFPEQPTPNVTTFFSEYSIGSFIYGENQLAVGLDFFLGSDYPYATFNPNNPNFSGYLTRSFTSAHLVSKTLKPLVEDLTGYPEGQTLLDMMVHNGKKLYLLDHILPHVPDSIKLEMTGLQVNWLADNEREMWAYFLDENLLYSTEWQKVRKYVDYSPSSPGMPPEAPGRTANWIGWKIIESFMKRNPEVSMQELVGMMDAQELLDRSKYKPAL